MSKYKLIIEIYNDGELFCIQFIFTLSSKNYLVSRREKSEKL